MTQKQKEILQQVIDMLTQLLEEEKPFTYKNLKQLPHTPTIKYLISVVCDTYKVSQKMLLSKARLRNIVYARWALWHWMWDVDKTSLSEISLYFHKWDRTSIANGVHKYQEFLSTYNDPNIALYDDIQKRMLSYTTLKLCGGINQNTNTAA